MIPNLIAETLDILPVQLRVKVICRPRYTCQACVTPITQAPAPPRGQPNELGYFMMYRNYFIVRGPRDLTV